MAVSDFYIIDVNNHANDNANNDDVIVIVNNVDSDCGPKWLC